MPACVTVSLRDPVADRLDGRFEFTSQPLRSPSGASQGDAQTIWRRKAGGYGGLDFGMVDTSSPKGQGSTKWGQLHPPRMKDVSHATLLLTGIRKGSTASDIEVSAGLRLQHWMETETRPPVAPYDHRGHIWSRDTSPVYKATCQIAVQEALASGTATFGLFKLAVSP